jgi:hypothetical protein
MIGKPHLDAAPYTPVDGRTEIGRRRPAAVNNGGKRQ